MLNNKAGTDQWMWVIGIVIAVAILLFFVTTLSAAPRPTIKCGKGFLMAEGICKEKCDSEKEMAYKDPKFGCPPEKDSNPEDNIDETKWEYCCLSIKDLA